MRFRLLTTLIALGPTVLAPIRAIGQTVAPAAALQARVDSIFAPYDNRTSPGCAVAVMRDGAIIYERGYGMADLEHDIPNSPETIFDIGSTAKQFAAMSIMLLERDGKLSLNDDVRRHIPELPDYGDTVRIRHLLTHTSGVRDYIGLLTLGGARYDDVTTDDDALAAIVRQKALNFTPGSRYLYSNSGFFLLSVIVKRASGMSLRDFARQRLFDPLGMTNTHYLSSYDSIVRNRAIGYSPRDEEAPTTSGFRADMPRWLQTGDGGVSTTVRELARWDANFYRPMVGDSAMIAELQRAARLTSGKEITYALGLRVDKYRGVQAVSHGGSWGGYRAELIRFPTRRFSVATLCNLGSSDPSALARRVADVYLADVLGPAPTVAARADRTARPTTRSALRPSTPLTQLAGLYRNVQSGETIVVSVAGDTAFVVMSRPHALRFVGNNEFLFSESDDGARLTIQPATRARARTLTWREDGSTPEVFEGIDAAQPTPAELSAMAGTYFSEELQALYTLAVVDGALELRGRNRPPTRLRPSVRNEFTSQSGSVVLRFEKPDSTFTLGIGRVKGLRFERVK
ncbi:MAG TPA: serine hydrolase domain-containing protein [Gemmatimonadaceae bacterium]|nr:serine hydrolase domain-containing protein [Gemmatimonadaceae bacterium]